MKIHADRPRADLLASGGTDPLAEPAHLRSLLEQMHEGVVLCELIRDGNGKPIDYRYLAANGSAGKIVGISAQGQRAYELHPTLEKFWLKTFSRVVQTGEPAAFTRLAAPLGRWFMVRAYHYAGNRFVILFLDVTEQKASEAESRRAQKVKLKAGRLDALGALASTLAHEIAQPLAAATNYLSVIEMIINSGSGLDAGVIRQAAAAAQAEHLRAGEIIKRMKSFAMEGRIATSPEPISEIVASAAKEALAELEAGGVLLTLDLPPGLNVLADRVQLEQVFINLLRNAATAMREQEGPRHISVSAVGRGASVRVAVQDSGPGIPRDQLPLIFDTFRSETTGMGLGLAICRTIIEAHHGTIQALASKNGAEFRILIPAA